MMLNYIEEELDGQGRLDDCYLKWDRGGLSLETQEWGWWIGRKAKLSKVEY